MIKFMVEEREDFSVVNFELDGPLSPQDLPEVLREFSKENLKFNKGIVISGRGPIWLYGTLIHECHPAKWIACYDPRLVGGVVIESHDPRVKVGEVIKE